MAGMKSFLIGLVLGLLFVLLVHSVQRVARWFPPLCAAFDFVVAVALLIGPWRPLA